MAVRQLIDQVAAWAKQRKWAVDRQEKQIRQSRLGDYEVPLLVVRAPAGLVYLEPVARYVQMHRLRRSHFNTPDTSNVAS